MTLVYTVGDRVAHRDMSAPDARVLPMRGTVVAVKTTLLVEWDDDSDRYEPLALGAGEKRAHEYAPDFLLPFTTDAT